MNFHIIPHSPSTEKTRVTAVYVLVGLLSLISFAAAGAEQVTLSKNELKKEFARSCENPERAFPTPPPRHKMDALIAWCGCVSDAIDRIPEDKLQQVLTDTYAEYPLYKADPRGFVPTKEYSMLRISKGCAQRSVEPADKAPGAAARPRTENHDAAGNLASTSDLGCIGAEKWENKYTPVDLYTAASKCAMAGKYQDGVLLFAVAGVYGRFDTLRVMDKTAHQAVAVARVQALGPLDKEKQTAFKDSLSQLLGNPDGLAGACKEIIRVGPPAYYPRYMIQHGMGAFSKNASSDGLVKDFDAEAAWKQALGTYLHCPGL